MSFDAIQQAFNLPPSVKGNTRLVAIALANHTNIHPEHGNTPCCWPSINGIAAAIGAGRTTVKEALAKLEAIGCITRIARRDGEEDLTNLYQWHPWRMEDWDDEAMQKVEDTMRGYSRRPQEPQEQPSDPTPAPTPTPTPKKPQKRATAIPDDWKPSPDLEAKTFSKYPSIPLDIEVEKFVAYHQSRGNKRVSWDASWRQWCANGAGYANGAWAQPAGSTPRDALPSYLANPAHPDPNPTQPTTYDLSGFYAARAQWSTLK